MNNIVFSVFLIIFCVSFRYLEYINMNRDKLIQTFLEKNKQINLSAIRDEEWVRVKHIQDSLELEKIIDRKEWMRIADIWTGWWFPLMPLAISHPECNFVWIDSVRKKTIAVWEILERLGVKNVEMMRTRIEDIKNQTFDLVTARAVAYSDKLLNRATPLVKKWWKIALMKQANDEEKKILLDTAKKKKLVLEKEYNYKLFNEDIERVIYILSK